MQPFDGEARVQEPDVAFRERGAVGEAECVEAIARWSAVDTHDQRWGKRYRLELCDDNVGMRFHNVCTTGDCTINVSYLPIRKQWRTANMPSHDVAPSPNPPPTIHTIAGNPPFPFSFPFFPFPCTRS